MDFFNPRKEVLSNIISLGCILGISVNFLTHYFEIFHQKTVSSFATEESKKLDFVLRSLAG